MTEIELLEAIAMTIYLNEGGCTPEEWEKCSGKKKRKWKIEGAEWDMQPDIELCEHERDEYRWQANAVIDFLKENPPPAVIALGRALHRCMKATGLSLNPVLIEAMGDDEQSQAAQQAWEALKMAFPKAFDEEP